MHQQWEDEVFLGAEAMVTLPDGNRLRDDAEAGRELAAREGRGLLEPEPLDEDLHERDRDLRTLIQHIFTLHRD